MESKNNVNVVEDDMAEVISNRMIESLNMSESSPPIINHTGPHSAGSTEFEFQAVESRENGHASISGSEGWTEDTCPICLKSYNNPRLLDCLHTLCEECIVALLEGKEDSENDSFKALEPSKCNFKPPPGVVRCPVCNQDTNVGNDVRWVKHLVRDHLASRHKTGQSAETGTKEASCESCKAKRAAVAGCYDCENFLCDNCFYAHRYMRCFDNHRVFQFDEFANSANAEFGSRLLTCQIHTNEFIRHFCFTCRVLTCRDCTMQLHAPPEHKLEIISAQLVADVREEIQSLLSKAQAKKAYCESFTANTDKRLKDLNANADLVRREIEQHANICIEWICKIRNNLLAQVEYAHSESERKIAENSRKLDLTCEKMNDAFRFTGRLLKNGSTSEILSTSRIIVRQLVQLVHSIPGAEVSTNVVFTKDIDAFIKAVSSTFGSVSIKEGQKELITPKISPWFLENTSSPSSSTGPLMQNVCYSNATAAYVASLSSGISADVGQQMRNYGSNTSSIASFSLASNYDADYANNVMMIASKTSAMAVYKENNKLNNYLGNSFLNSNAALTLGMRQMPTVHDEHKNDLSNFSSTYYFDRISNLFPAANVPSSSGMNAYNFCNNLSHLSEYTGPAFYHSSLLQNSSNTTSSTWSMPSTVRRPVSMNEMKIKANFGEAGSGPGQFCLPQGFCITPDGEVIVADTQNHRIQVLDLNGQSKIIFSKMTDHQHLISPRRVILSRDGTQIIVGDCPNDQTRLVYFTRCGKYIKHNSIPFVQALRGLAISWKGEIVMIDLSDESVIFITESFEILHCFSYRPAVAEPSDLAVVGDELYIADLNGHAVTVFSFTGSVLRKIGGEHFTPYPFGVDVSDEGDVVVGSWHGNQIYVVVFKNSGDSLCHYQCSEIPMKRCNGLRITSQGFIAIMSMESCSFLVLDTLYVKRSPDRQDA
ncbi:E3 ubiquitin-protein ligase TRIM33 [Trichinella zimbabwensis]|uniref:E3 ubiquitin-protein ligase TRIM33 n=1 Tax=Trichinella zimbabwensis TaxID=268475 RepID=A0A0V1HYV5_9BILA|nr:E3 ubiquitin-protein ligase TRIM33 [Trichinella zimbabwensis]